MLIHPTSSDRNTAADINNDTEKQHDIMKKALSSLRDDTEVEVDSSEEENKSKSNFEPNDHQQLLMFTMWLFGAALRAWRLYA